MSLPHRSPEALIVENDLICRERYVRTAERLGFLVTCASGGDEARNLLGAKDYALVLIALESDALDSFARLARRSGSARLLARLSGSDFGVALRAGRAGAHDCITRDSTDETIERAFAAAVPAAPAVPISLQSTSPVIRSTVEVLSAAARCSAPLLIRGPHGIGKRAVARWLHARAGSGQESLSVVSCRTLREGELTAEHVQRGGSLLLEEVAELPAGGQAHLLALLQGSVLRHDETLAQRRGVRLLSTSARDLPALVVAERFSAELYYLLNVFEVRLPSLSERRMDILPIAGRLLDELSGAYGRVAPELDDSARQVLLRHDWPGNVRELRNELERALALCPGDVLTGTTFSERIRAEPPVAPALGGDFTLEEIERDHIERVVSRMPSFEAAARLLGIDDSTLWRKRKRFATRPPKRASGPWAA